MDIAHSDGGRRNGHEGRRGRRRQSGGVLKMHEIPSRSAKSMILHQTRANPHNTDADVDFVDVTLHIGFMKSQYN